MLESSLANLFIQSATGIYYALAQGRIKRLGSSEYELSPKRVVSDPVTLLIHVFIYTVYVLTFLFSTHIW